MKDNDNTHRLSISKIQRKKGNKQHVSDIPPARPVNNPSTQYVKQVEEREPPKEVIKTLNSFERQNSGNYYPYSQSPQDKDDDGEINLKEYLEIVFHYKWLIFIVFLTVLIVTAAYSLTRVPEYKASTKIFIHEDAMELQLINNKPYFKQSYDLSTWIQIINSTEITKRASEHLDGKLSFKQVSSAIQCDTERNEEHIISVSAKSLNPQMAADLANTIYIALSEYDTEQRMKGYDYSVNYLETLLSDKHKALDNVNNSINDFMIEKGIDVNTLNLEDNIDRINDLQKQIASGTVELAAVNASISKINYDLNREDQSIVNETTYSEPYKIRLMNLETEKARALTNYTEKHPKVIAIQQNIDNVKKLIEAGMNEKIQLKNVSANPIKQRLVNDLLARETDKVALEQKIKALKKIISEIEISTDFKKLLEDKFDKKKDLTVQIANLQGQYNNAKLNSNIASSRLYQLQAAEVPTGPSSDNLKRNLLVGIVLGLGLGIGLAIMLNFLNDKIRSVNDYQNKYAIPMIGTIPKTAISPMSLVHLKLKYRDWEGGQKDLDKDEKINEKLPPEVEKIREDEFRKIECLFEPIVINFKYLMLKKEQKVFAIQSPLHKEGKTFMSYFLAQCLAKENLNVLLMDTDFFKRTLTGHLRCKEEKGLSEVLSEQIDLSNVIQRRKEDKYWFLPAGKKPPNVLEMYRSGNFKEVINRLKGIYDIIIIDTPAFLPVPSITYFLSEVDGTILPVRIGSTTHSNLSRVISKSKLYNINVMGAILNNAQIIDRQYYKYEYNYSYYYDNEDRDSKTWKRRFKKLRNKYFSSKVEEESVDGPIDEGAFKQSIFARLYYLIKGYLVFEEEE